MTPAPKGSVVERIRAIADKFDDSAQFDPPIRATLRSIAEEIQKVADEMRELEAWAAKDRDSYSVAPGALDAWAARLAPGGGG